jgi:CBS domain-containing protein
MTVQDVMTRQVVSCRTDMNLAEVCALMWEKGCGALPVVTDTGEVTGVLTDRDICIALGTRNAPASELKAGDVAQCCVQTCNPSDDIHTALQQMREARIRRLPVVDDESRLAGILSIGDVLMKARPNGKMGTVISYGDAVTALQAICKSGARTHTRTHIRVAAA